MATKKPKPTAEKAVQAKSEKKGKFIFSATIEMAGKEVGVNFEFKRKQFFLKKQLIQVADLFDESGNAKKESADILSHLIEINSGIIQKID